MLCKCCNEDFPQSEFPFRKNTGKLRGTCKTCKAKQQAKWYKAHYKQHVSNVSARKRKNVEIFKAYKKTLCCEICGERHIACLDFHHKDPAEKEIAVSVMAGGGMTLTKLMEEIEKCIVLCSNCHRKLHYELNGGVA